VSSTTAGQGKALRAPERAAMHICRLTRTEKNELVLRIPKALWAGLDLKSDDVILHQRGKYIIIEAATARLSKLAACRLLNEKRISVYGKTK